MTADALGISSRHINLARLAVVNSVLSVRILLAYRSALAVDSVNMLIKLFAVSVLWTYLITSSDVGESIFRIAPGLPSYSMMAVILGQSLSWWKGPQSYLSEQVRSGSIIYDLTRPLPLIIQIFSMELGKSVASTALISLPGLVVAVVFFGLRAPSDLATLVAFPLQFVLAWTVLFFMNFAVAILSAWTFQVVGVQHFYHGIIVLLSGAMLPLEFFPDKVRVLLEAIPFSSIFYRPLGVWLGTINGPDLLWSVAVQVIHALFMCAIALILWSRARLAFVVQGG